MKTKVLAPVFALLVLGFNYWIWPFWWETYRFVDDQIDVRLDARRSEAPPEEGTLVIRLTGRGPSKCTWDPVSTSASGSASEFFVELDNISTAFTDAEGVAPAPSYSGFGTGRRHILGGCRQNRAYLLLVAREGFETRRVIPHAGKENFSGVVLHEPEPRSGKETQAMHDTRRIWTALRLLYPSQLAVIALAPLDDNDRRTILETARYWSHTTPDQRMLRNFALDRIAEVAESLDCLRLRVDLLKLLKRLATTPEGVPAIVAEHSAIMALLHEFSRSSAPDNICESEATT